MLPVVVVRGDVLPVHGPSDLTQYGFDLCEQVVRRLGAEILDSLLVETQAVPEFLRGGAEWRVDVVVCQAMNRQPVDDP